MEKLPVIAYHADPLIADEFTSSLQKIRVKYFPFINEEELRSVIKQYSPAFVLDRNFHSDFWEVCCQYDIKYACWATDSGMSNFIQLYKDKIRDKDYFFLFEKNDYAIATRLHPQSYYLPFSAGDKFLKEPRKDGFECDIAFIMNPIYEYQKKINDDLATNIANAPNEQARKNLILVQKITELAVDICGQDIIGDKLTPTVDVLCQKCGVNPFVNMDKHKSVRLMGMIMSSNQRQLCLKVLADTGAQIHLYGNHHWKATKVFKNLSDNVNYKALAPYNSIRDIANSAKICINLTQVQNIQSLPQRIFHFAASGSFFISNYSAALNELFADGTCYGSYKSFDDLREKVKYYLANDELRYNIALNAHKEFLAKHTMDSRLSKIIDVVITT